MGLFISCITELKNRYDEGDPSKQNMMIMLTGGGWGFCGLVMCINMWIRKRIALIGVYGGVYALG